MTGNTWEDLVDEQGQGLHIGTLTFSCNAVGRTFLENVHPGDTHPTLYLYDFSFAIRDFYSYMNSYMCRLYEFIFLLTIYEFIYLQTPICSR
jgi:hypothetical protein